MGLYDFLLAVGGREKRRQVRVVAFTMHVSLKMPNISLAASYKYRIPTTDQ